MELFTAAAADASGGPTDGTRRQRHAVLVFWCRVTVMNHGYNNMHLMYYVTVSVAQKSRWDSYKLEVI